MPYAFYRTISDVLCNFKRFHNFIFHQSARYLWHRPGVKVGSLVRSAIILTKQTPNALISNDMYLDLFMSATTSINLRSYSLRGPTKCYLHCKTLP